jgi:hypothetical protein
MIACRKRAVFSQKRRSERRALKSDRFELIARSALAIMSNLPPSLAV